MGMRKWENRLVVKLHPRHTCDIMLDRSQYNGITWVDVESPDLPEVRELMNEFSLDPSVAEEMLSPNIAPKLQARGDTTVLILHFPALKHSHTEDHVQEIDFVLTNSALITVRYDTIDALLHFGKVFEVTTMLKKEHGSLTATGLFLTMLDKLYGGVAHELDFLDRTMRDVEEKIFQGNEKEMVREISLIDRNLLSVRRALAPHAPLLTRAQPILSLYANTETAVSFERIFDDLGYLTGRVQSAIESLRELRDTNDSLLHAKQNEVMKTLTILAFVTFPLTLIAGIFSMNTETTPIVGVPGDFWVITTVMLLATALMFAFFKYKHWL